MEQYKHIYATYAAGVTYLEVTLMNGHYDLIVDRIDKSGYEVSAGTNHQVIEIADSPCKSVELQTKQELIKKENYFENVMNIMSFSTNPETIEVTDSPCKKIEPLKTKTYKREIDSDGDSDDSSDNDLLHIETILKTDNVPDVCTQFESSSSSLWGNSHTGTEITSWMDAETEEPVKYQGKRRSINFSVFKDLQWISVKQVPLGIDGTIIYEVPQNKILNQNNCKGLWPWRKAQISKSKEFDRGPSVLSNCRAS